MISKISRKTPLTAPKHLTKTKTETTTKKDLADILAKSFSANSSLDNSNPQNQSRETKTQLQVQ